MSDWLVVLLVLAYMAFVVWAYLRAMKAIERKFPEG